MIPAAQDPRLNTVECVVEGHNNFNVQIFSASRKLLMCVCWCVLIFSVVLGSFVSNYLVRWLPKGNIEGLSNEKLKCNIKSLNVLIWVMSFFEEVLIILAVVLAKVYGHGGFWYPVTYLVAVHFFTSFFCYVWFEGGRKRWICLTLIVFPFMSVVAYSKCSGENSGEKLRNTMVYFFSQTTIHHLSWIIQGVMTEPLWAIPFLAVICGVWVVVYLLVYFYYDSSLPSHCDKVKAIAVSFILIVSVVLQLLALVVVAQSFLSTDPVTGLASSVLTGVGTWWLQRVVMKPKTKETKEENVAETVQPSTSGNGSAEAHQLLPNLYLRKVKF